MTRDEYTELCISRDNICTFCNEELGDCQDCLLTRLLDAAYDGLDE